MALHRQLMDQVHLHPGGRSFFWQGLLILLPVLVLASAGFLSLRQDRILARHEAVEKAQTLADQIADVIWTRLFRQDALTTFERHAFRVDASGKLIFPPPAGSVPVPVRLDPSQLPEEQRRLWVALNSVPALDRPQWIAASQKFLALSPAPEFAGPAHFRLGHQLDDAGDHEAAAKEFELVASGFSETVGESGLPLQTLAGFKALQIRVEQWGPQTNLAANTQALQILCSNLVRHSHFLTSHLLERLTELQLTLHATNVVEPWREAWKQQEALRQLAEAALAQVPRSATETRAQARVADEKETDHSDAAAVRLPSLFWFHAVDESPMPQPLFPPSKTIFIKGVPSHNNVASVSVTKRSTPNPPEATSSPIPPRPPFDRFWLAAKLNHADGGYSIVCRALGLWSPTAPFVGSPQWDALRESIPSLPPWLNYTVEIAGVTLSPSKDMQHVLLAHTDGVTLAASNRMQRAEARPENKSSTQLKGNSSDRLLNRSDSDDNLNSNRETGNRPEVLARATQSEGGQEYLAVQMYFVSPNLFYARQQVRTYVFGGLIGVAVLTALLGFVAARRAYLRQHQLIELKSNFVSSVSHELRAPIASMRLLAESLQRGKISDPGRQADYFRFLVQECRRLSGLIENVLNFARIEQGCKQYELERTDVPGLLEQTVKLMEPAATEKQVSLTLAPPAHPAAVSSATPWLDGPAIQQALINLIDNALKHSPPGDMVTVGFALRGPDGQLTDHGPTLLEFYVQDHGPGIPAEEHERIFERFYRLGSELRRETQGIGIGLSIVKHIVEGHGGRVRVESTLGQGTRFILQLPVNTTLKRTANH